MPSKSPKQRRFMAAAANNPDFARRAGIPQSVASEYHEADKAKGMYEGGLAPMNDIIQRGMAGGLERLAEGFQEGGEVPDWERRLGSEPLTLAQIRKKLGAKGPYGAAGALVYLRKHGWRTATDAEDQDLTKAVFYPPTAFGPTMAGEDTNIPAVRTPGYDPYYGRGPGTTGGRGGRRGRGPRGRGPGGGRRRPPNGEDGPPPPRIIPPGRPPGGGLVPPQIPPDYTPPDRRAGRDTEYSRALREHRARVAATLGVPSGYAGGGAVNEIPASREVGYAEGGTTRADNPYPRGSARWKVWERRHGRDPNAPDEPETPPVAAEEPEEDDRSWLDRLRGVEGERRGRTEEELEKLEEGRYRGGYIPASREVGYQMGGLAAATPPRLRPPMGGVPPTMGGMRPRGGIPMRAQPPIDRYAFEPPSDVRGIRPGMGPRGGMPRPIDPRYGRPPTDLPGAKRLPGGRIMVPPSAGPPGGGPGMPGPMGGPRIPPNLRGLLQRRMMENRPRRAIPGPAGAGGAPNRVGQADQQGGLARALQRGTGRPPMSRRQGFYR